MTLINNKEEIQRTLKDLSDVIKNATDVISSGEEIDLDGLDDKVDIACTAVEKSTPEIARSVEPQMAEMIASLEVLAGILKSFQEEEIEDDE